MIVLGKRKIIIACMVVFVAVFGYLIIGAGGADIETRNCSSGRCTSRRS